MKSFELKPTPENFLETLCNDSLGRNSDLFFFIQILNNIDDACSISLDGGWGSGKTFFVNHAKMILDANNSLISTTNESEMGEINKIKTVWKEIKGNRQIDLVDHVAVYYDAWANDNDEDPVLSLVYSILKSSVFDCQLNPSVEINVKKLVLSIIDLFSGKDFSKLANAFESNNPIESICKEKDIQESITEFFNSLLPEKGDRLVIFVDELDRCRPSYAVRLLERINHYFANERITFVFSINTNELQHTIKQYYGAQFDASKYLSRFFKYRLSIPILILEKYYKSLQVEITSHRFDAVCGAVVRSFNFEIRDIAQYLDIINAAARKQVLSYANRNSFLPYQEGLYFAIDLFVPLIIGLKIHNQSLYNSFINGKDDSVLIDIFSKIDRRYFHHLFDEKVLSEDEIFDNGLKEFYRALFNDKVLAPNDGFRIGKLLFQSDIRKRLLEISNMFSNFVNFD